MKFARVVFRAAAVYGILVIAPLYFMESLVGELSPPAITHPEHFYGFVGVTLAWQVAFLIIAQRPDRYRPLMLAAVAEKAGFGVAGVVLFLQQRAVASVLAFGLIDLLLGSLFVAAYAVTPPFDATQPQ